MGAIIDARNTTASSKSLLVKVERPKEITKEALVGMDYRDWQRKRHGQLDTASIREDEVPGVLAILEDNPDMDVREALRELRDRH